ncbi:hypothetical protein HUK80_06415 [Flavobacterium sp. MAH-1]|uniref:Lipoprotein n=1 Tax=Flavobacterium agri TaxID=2743471 RepID=A0A7Y9C6S0_9FLAO|nr:hypothetical protein [Flavobacterium agri]NUY80522.1 hypothetical protein [Flavobacterium agri]NYA70547.1 hypothetical protein [Flavobacterium agri]
MKMIKFLLTTGLVVAIFACSSESEDVSVKNQIPIQENPGGATAKLNATDLSNATTAWNNMIASTAYQNYQSAMLSFTAKMNKNTPIWTGKTDAMTWINTNLSLTLFPSVAAFEIAYDDCQTRWSSIISNNSTLFSTYFPNADASDRHTIMAASITRLPAQSSTCLDGCLNAWTVEVEGWENLWCDWCGGGNQTACWLGEVYYNAHVSMATYTFNDCADNC